MAGYWVYTGSLGAPYCCSKKGFLNMDSGVVTTVVRHFQVADQAYYWRM